MFFDMLGDEISIQKQNGQIFDRVKASVQGNTVYIFDIELPLEEGDKIYRPLPSGSVEVYVVQDRGFINDPYGGSLSHYEAKVRRESSITNERYKSTTINLKGNLKGNARININSTDNSLNKIEQDTSVLFEKIRIELQSIKDDMVRENAIKTLEEM
ncbi:MAG: hypothetical protein LBR23_02935, partial [Spirochaetaceae bacterium]|nr:hypothetical protein [Spirochaetaceae bacterium]